MEPPLSANVYAARMAAWLRDQLARRAWSGADLARALELNDAVVHRWLKGVLRPSTASCRRIGTALAVPLLQVLAVAGHVPDSAAARASSDDVARRVDLLRVVDTQFSSPRARTLLSHAIDAAQIFEARHRAAGTDTTAMTPDDGASFTAIGD